VGGRLVGSHRLGQRNVVTHRKYRRRGGWWNRFATVIYAQLIAQLIAQSHIANMQKTQGKRMFSNYVLGMFDANTQVLAQFSGGLGGI
jgi:hypothetical protein